MEIITCEVQEECRQVLTALNCFEVFRPTPPIPYCDGIMSIDEQTWLVGSNNAGTYTLWMLTETTHDEAWAFFRRIRGEKNHYINPRLTVLGDCGPVNPLEPSNN